MTQYTYLGTYEGASADPQNLILTTSLGNKIVVDSKEVTLHHNGNWSLGYSVTMKNLSDDESWENSFDNYSLVVTNNDVVGTPEVETYFVTIPGSSAVLDLSEYISDQVAYRQRTLTYNFAFEMDPDLCMPFFSNFLSKYHGKRVWLVNDNDPEWCYEGRAKVGALKRNLSICEFTMTVECDPYKYAFDSTAGTVDKTETCL